jgi:hypothetical protein
MASYTTQQPALKRVQYDPGADGSVIAQAFFEVALVNDADPADRITKPWTSVSFVLPADLAAQVEALAIESNARLVDTAITV